MSGYTFDDATTQVAELGGCAVSLGYRMPQECVDAADAAGADFYKLDRLDRRWVRIADRFGRTTATTAVLARIVNDVDMIARSVDHGTGAT